jgi:hypothetical protein
MITHSVHLDILLAGTAGGTWNCSFPIAEEYKSVFSAAMRDNRVFA